MTTSREKFILTILLFLLKRELHRSAGWDATEVNMHIGVVQNEKKKLDRAWDEGNEIPSESQSPLTTKPEKPILAESGQKL